MSITLAALKYYATPGRFTTFGNKDIVVVKKLPKDVKQLSAILHGLLIHQYVARDFFAASLSEEKIDKETHLRSAADILHAIEALDAGPLTEQRAPNARVAGVCHHFAKLLLAILRAQGTSARMRYGFGDYFNPGSFEDHSLVEYWNKKEHRWVLADPQFDETWRWRLKIRHDVLDVPRDRFWTASQAWIACREGKQDPRAFGITPAGMSGLWFIAGNLAKDLAALNKMEMLQWDAWSGMPRPNNTMKDKKRLAFFDRIAALTADPDTNFTALRKTYNDASEKIAVPACVFNAVRRHLEHI